MTRIKLIVGIVLTVIGVLLLIPAFTMFFLSSVYFSTTTETVQNSNLYAIVIPVRDSPYMESDDFNLGLGSFAEIRIRAEPFFAHGYKIGIAKTAVVSQFLANASYLRIEVEGLAYESSNANDNVRISTITGNGSLDIEKVPTWDVEDTRNNPQINWNFKSGSYSIVIFKTDYSVGMDTDVVILFKIPFLAILGYIFGFVAVVLLIVGIVLFLKDKGISNPTPTPIKTSADPFAGVTPAKSIGELSPSTGTIFCPYCGSKFEKIPDSLFCPKCGEKIE